MGAATAEARDLFMHLLDLDWDKRYTAEQALQHPWFKDLPPE